MNTQIIINNQLWNYLIYDDGRVYSLFSKKFLSPDTSTGYARFLLCNGKMRKRFNAHYLVALHFLPNPQNLPIVHHKDNNRLNNSVENLEWISYADNVKSYNCQRHEKLTNIVFSEQELVLEEWRIFRDGRYMVSNLGRLKNTDKNKILEGHVNPVTLYIRDNLFFRDGSTATIARHRIVWEAFHPDENMQIINHIDGNKINNRLNNLENISSSENMCHVYKVLKNKKTRKCKGININNGQECLFFSISDAAKAIHCDESNIRGALNRGQGNISHNYRWYNLSDEEFYNQVLKSSETIESVAEEKTFGE